MQDENTTWNVATYARLSREDGVVGQSDSITGQIDLMRDWAKRRDNVRIVCEYVDDGYSGATFERPGFERMISDAGLGKFDTIVVKDLSRFGRSYLDCGFWIERGLPDLGIRLYSITDDFDSMSNWDYNTALLLPMKNLINEMQVILTSEKVRASLAAKRSRGECVANFAPFGYVKDPDDKHKLIVDEPAATTVRRIFALFASGESASSIARTFNLEGIASPAQRKAEVVGSYRSGFSMQPNPKWHSKTVLRILENEAYTGTLVQGKTHRPSWRFRSDVSVPRDRWQRSASAHDPIVDEGLFSAAQSRLAEVRARDKRTDFNVLIMVQIICGGCGGPMKRVVVASRNKDYAYYVCATHRENVRVCSTHSIREERLLGQLESFGSCADRPLDMERMCLVVHSDGQITMQGKCMPESGRDSLT